MKEEKKYSQCCGIIALRKPHEQGYFCSHCLKDCETQDYYDTKETLLLTKIKELLQEILKALKEKYA